MLSGCWMGEVTPHCMRCRAELAGRDILMLATIPPSHLHLAVKEGREEDAYATLNKVENVKGGKSIQYCPYIVHYNFACKLSNTPPIHRISLS